MIISSKRLLKDVHKLIIMSFILTFISIYLYFFPEYIYILSFLRAMKSVALTYHIMLCIKYNFIDQIKEV